MSKNINVGLIGYGFSGRTFHAPVITTIPHLKLKKVVQRNSMSAKERYPSVEVVDNVQNVYLDKDIDLIVITTPSTNHFKFIKEALLAGKHVVVEKPFTPYSREADELIDLAKEQGKMLSVFHNRRWDGDFLTIREMLQNNMLGNLIEAEFRWEGFSPTINPESWRDSSAVGSGVLYDLGVHLLDQALCLFGVPKTIKADVRMVRDGAETVDYFNLTLSYKDGFNVNVKSSMLAKEPGPRYTIHGSKGSFVKYGVDPQEELLKKRKTPASPDWGREEKDKWGKLNTSVNNLHFVGLVETIPGSYQSYYQNVYDHISGLADLIVKPEQARMSVYLIEMALKSHREQRTVEVT